MAHPYIVETPGTCGGLPRIEGTRITVNLIVREHSRAGKKPEEIAAAHPHLTLAQVYSALAYYFDNREAVDASLRAADQVEAEMRSRFPPRLPS